jgi:acetyl esterase/lipase
VHGIVLECSVRRAAFIFLIVTVAALSHAQYRVRETRDIVYTSASGFAQKLDLFMPDTPRLSRRPAIIFVHGGGWSGGDKSAFMGMARYYAAKGYVCTSINYRLTPTHIWPAQIDDTQAAVRWMRKNAGILGLNPNRIGAVGASAGGHLVLFLGSTDTLTDFDPALSGYSSRVQAVVDYFGPSDLTSPLEWSPSIWNLIVSLVGHQWLPNSPYYQAVSPLNFVNAGDAPTVVFHGTADAVVPVDQSRRLVAKMQLNGVPVNYSEFPGEGHGFTGPVSTTCVGIINSFFATRLGG